MRRWAFGLGLLSFACSPAVEDVRLPAGSSAPGYVMQLDDEQGTRRIVLGSENRGFEVEQGGQFTLHALGSSAEALQLGVGPLPGSGERSLPVLQSYWLSEQSQWEEVGAAEALTAPAFDDTACGAACVHRTQCDLCVGEAALYSICAPCEAEVTADLPQFDPHVCPSGWEALVFDDGHRSCEPPEPEGVRQACPDDERYDLIAARCLAVAPCQAPTPVIPMGWSVDYVDAQAPAGGLGTIDQPRNRLLDQYSDTVVVIQSGRYPSSLTLDDNVHLVGAGTCTVLTAASTMAPALNIRGTGVELRALAMEGLQTSSESLVLVGRDAELELARVSLQTGRRRAIRSHGALALREVRVESSVLCAGESQCEPLATVRAYEGSLMAEGIDVVSAVGVSGGRVGGDNRPGADVHIQNARFLGDPSGGGVGLSVDLGALVLRDAWFVDQGRAAINIDHIDVPEIRTATLSNVHIRGSQPDFGITPPLLTPALNNAAGIRVVARENQSLLILREVSVIGQRRGISAGNIIFDAQDVRISDVGEGVVIVGDGLEDETHVFDRLWLDYYGGAGIGLMRSQSGVVSLHDTFMRDSCGESCPTLSTSVPGGGVAVMDTGSAATRLEVSQSHFLPARGAAFSAFIAVIATDVAVRSPRGPPIRINTFASALRLERVLLEGLRGPPLRWTGDSTANHLNVSGAGPLLCLHQGALGTLEQFRFIASGEAPVLVLAELTGIVLRSNDFTIKEGVIERPDSAWPLLMKSDVVDCSTAFETVESSLMSDVHVVVQP